MVAEPRYEGYFAGHRDGIQPEANSVIKLVCSSCISLSRPLAARGARLGRPPARTAEQIRHARDLLTRPGNTIFSIARLL